MAIISPSRTQINVRVDQRVIDLLNARVAAERIRGRRITKEQLVADAITSAYGSARVDWLPVHRGKWNPTVDPGSTSALFDWIDQAEAQT